MIRGHIVRCDQGDQGTFGRFFISGLNMFSMELPWRGNASNISCIPLGVYTCRWTMSPRFKRRMYEVGPVPGRSGVRIHPANLAGDVSKGYRAQLNGCLAFGDKLGTLDGQKALLLSRPAVRRFEQVMVGETFELEISEVK